MAILNPFVHTPRPTFRAVHTLAMALDPSLVMVEAGIVPDPWQKQLLLITVC